jgi:integrase
MQRNSRSGRVNRIRILIERYANLRARVLKDGWSAERTARKYRTTEAAVEVALTMTLPPIRFHDIRHGAATMLIAAGVDDKFVSDVLGHASSSFTKDVYAVITEEMATDATTRIAAFIPRQNRLVAVGASSVPSGGK